MRARLATALGLVRSLVVYYAVPRRQGALKRFYAGLVQPRDLVFDIGAHVGNRTRALHALGARVVAVEPQPVFASFLKLTLPAKRVELVRAAVGRSEGNASLSISRRHPTVSTLSPHFIAAVEDAEGFRQVVWDDAVEVRVTTLDRLIERYGRPAFCKIDVEGMEAEILHGLSEPLPLVAFEFLPAAIDVALACIDRLEALGAYRFNLVVGERHRMEFAGWRDAAAIREALAQHASGTRSGDVYARLDG